MTEDTIWDADPHTLAKHEILRRYLDAWFPILGSWQGRVVYLDAFAGPGIYKGGEPGSPIVALEALLNHPAFPKLNRCEFVFIFLEPREDRFKVLQEKVAELQDRHSPFPNNVHVSVLQQTFDEGAAEILSELEKQKAGLAPTFAFIDPFGFKDTPLELICRLLSFPRCEVLFTFMFDHINRFLEQESVVGHLKGLFGTTGFQEAGAKQGDERKEFLRDLFREQLKKECGFDYVTSFEMVNKQGHSIYFLFYGTRNIRGIEVMKSALWKVDPGGGVQFLDRFAGQSVLFQGDLVDVGPLRSALLDRFAGQEVSVEEINEYVVAETPYGSGHWNQKVLKPLEQDELIEVTTSRKRRLTYPAGTRVRFKPANDAR
jgi:three-Cys-motif partner protein